MRYLSPGFAIFVLLFVAPLPPFLLPGEVVQAQTVQNRKTESDRFLETAKQHYRKAEFKAAISLYQKALTQAQQTGDFPTQTEVLLQLGDISFWIGDVPQAEGKFQQALKLSREAKDRIREGSALALLSAVYRSRQDYAKAIELLKESSAIAQQTNNQKLEARSRFFTGIVLHLQQQYPQAIETFQQALELNQELNHSDETAHIENWMAITFIQLKDFKQAETTIQQQQKRSRDTGYRLAEYDGLATIASLKQQQNQTDAVLQARQRGLTIAKEADNPWFQRAVLVEIGFVYLNQKQVEKGLGFYQQALELTQRIDDRPLQAITLTQIGFAQVNQKNYDEAIAAFQQALTIQRSLKNQSEEAGLLRQIGLVYEKKEQPRRAIESLQAALKVAQAGNDRTTQASILVDIGRVYKDQRQVPQAIAALEQAISLHQAQGEQLSQGQLDEAISTSEKAIAVFEGVGANDRVAAVREILVAYQQRLMKFREANNLQGQSNTLNSVGSTYEALKQYPQMRESFQQAVTVARQMKSPVSEAIATLRFAQSYEAEGNIRLGKASFQPALEMHQQGLAALQVALKIVPAIPDSEKLKPEIKRLAIQGISQAYGLIGEAHNGLKQYPEAIKAGQQSLIFAQRVSNSEVQLNALEKLTNFSNNFGRQYRKEGKFQQALEAYRQATDYEQQVLTVAKQTKDQARTKSALEQISSIHYNIATVYRDQEQYLEAIKALEQGLAIDKQIGDRSSEALTLSLIASHYKTLSQYPQALERYQQALAISRQLKNWELEVTTLLSTGNVYIDWGQYPDALRQYQQALSIARARGNPGLEAIAIGNVGLVYNSQGQYALALTQYQRSLDVHRQIQQQLREVDTRDRTVLLKRLEALCSSSSSQYSPLSSGDLVGFSENLYNQLVEARRSGCQETSRYAESTILDRMAGIYIDQGRYQEALKVYEQSQAISIELRDPSGEAITIGNIGRVYYQQGQYTQALAFYQRALKVYENAGIRFNQAFTLNFIGDVYIAQSRYAQALEINQRASDIAQSITNARALQASTLRRLGVTYEQLGQYNQALTIYQKALVAIRAIEDRPMEADVLSDIGTVYRKENQPAQALEHYQQALVIWEGIGSVAKKSSTLKNIGLIYQAQGQFDRAIPLFQQAIKIQQEIGAQTRLADSLQGLGLAYTGQGNTEAALSGFQQALMTYRMVGDRAGEALILGNLGQLFTKQKQPELAIVFYKQSVNLQEDIRRGLKTLPKDQQQSYTETVSDTYRKLADLLLKRDRVLEAQQILDLLKIQELDNYLRNVRGTSPQLYELPPEQAILKKYNALTQSAIVLGQELNDLQQLSLTGKTLTSFQEKRKAELLDLQRDLKQQFNEFAQQKEIVALLKQLTPTEVDVTIPLKDLAGFGKKMAELNAVTLYPLVLDDRIELIITAPNAQPLRRTVNVTRQELNQTIQAFRAALQNPNQDAKPIAQKLYTWLIKPLEADLQAAKPTTIIYAPDGQLRYIPLAALHDGQQWLVQKYRINNITSKSIDDLTSKPEGKLRVLAGAFGTSNQQVSFAGQTFSFRGLAFTNTEVESLAKSVPGTTKLLGQAFTSKATTNEMNEYTIVHLATHASLVPEAANSFIVFGDGTATSLTDIQNWTLDNVDLVVLSACETGLGGKFGKNGEEVLGLGYQFTKPGTAKAAIASLWQVNDASTSLLMQQFYKTLATGRTTKAEALRQAQLNLLKSNLTAGDAQRAGVKRDTPPPVQQISPSNLSHPYYWAPFILIGNGL